MKPQDMPIVILAAGGSKRMRGRDKLLEPVDGLPLVRWQVEMAMSLGFAPVIVALPPSPHSRYEALAGLDITNVNIPDAQEGMNASLRRAIGAVPPNAPCAMVLLADLPDLMSDDLAKVAAAVDLSSDQQIWRGSTADGAPGHPIVFHRDLFDALMALTGDDGGKRVVAAAAGHVTLVPLPGDRARHDLDTPEAWTAWRARNSSR